MCVDERRDFFNIVNLFYNRLNNEDTHRYKSWEFCYVFFQEKYRDYIARRKEDEQYVLSDAEYDMLALHLGFYLASWGMYRGSSFLLQNSYKVHIGPIKYLFENYHSDLFERSEDINNFWKALGNSYSQLVNENNDNHLEDANQVDEEPICFTDTLFTKIMLGTFGCVPAYDRYCKAGLGVLKLRKKVDMFPQILSSDFYINLHLTSDDISNQYPNYSLMKVLDMFLFELGMIYENIKAIYELINTDWHNVTTEISKHFKETMKACAYLLNVEINPSNIYIDKCIRKIVADSKIAINERENATENLRSCLQRILEQNDVNQNLRICLQRILNQGQDVDHEELENLDLLDFDDLVQRCVRARPTKNNRDVNSRKSNCMDSVQRFLRGEEL